MFEFFIENSLITPNQSGFQTGNSGISQFISITYEIYNKYIYFLTYQKHLTKYDTKVFTKNWDKTIYPRNNNL